MTKQDILGAIMEFARLNAGRPPGEMEIRAFAGVTKNRWLRFWPRWTHAQREAGLEPNKANAALPEQVAVEKWVALARDLGRIPSQRDLIWKRNQDGSFPHRGVFDRLASPKKQWLVRVRQFCHQNGGNDDVVGLIDQNLGSKIDGSNNRRAIERTERTVGYVYLQKSGRFYKIGRSNAPGRRQYEVDLQTPEEVKTVHVIRTDDPAGIEAYWHKRFKAKWKRREWFDLDAADVQAFKRRDFM